MQNKIKSPNQPDFELLRAKRNAAVAVVIKAAAEKMGLKGPINHNFDYNACYCACPDGPCEHNFQGWRDFEDGRGGEQACKRCGMGAMTHSIRTAE